MLGPGKTSEMIGSEEGVMVAGLDDVLLSSHTILPKALRASWAIIDCMINRLPLEILLRFEGTLDFI